MVGLFDDNGGKEGNGRMVKAEGAGCAIAMAFVGYRHSLGSNSPLDLSKYSPD